MNDQIFETIKEFTIRVSYVRDFPLTRGTEIQRDLGIYGDDAVEFFEKFSKEFNVSISGFEIGNYFKAEGDPTLNVVIGFFKKKKKEKVYKQITLGDLEKAVIAGKLDASV